MEYNRILSRHVIDESLGHVYKYPLTLVVAPMGYGKTTAVIEYFKKEGQAIQWFFFELEESSPKYIWDTFIRQLNMTHEEIASKVKDIGFPFTTIQRNRFFDLVGGLVKEKPLFIVIDDYHFNKSKEVDEFMRLLICAGIEGLHLIILSRTTPELNVTELMLKDKCQKIDEKGFSLTVREVGKLFRLNKVSAPNEVIHQVYDLSEGWISAVMLLIDFYKDTGRVDSVERIESLIKTTLMKTFEADKRFIAILGILESFTVEQLVYLIGKEAARTLIDQIEALGAFVGYSSVSGRYMVHNIFMKYLYEAEFSRLTEGQQAANYRRLGQYHIEKGLVMEGIRCFQKANDYHLILKEFEKNTIMQVFDYYPEYVNTIISHIPKDFMVAYPVAYLCYLHFLISARDIEHGSSLFKDLLDHKEVLVKSARKNGVNLEGELAYLRGLMAYNKVEQMFDCMEAAAQLIGGPSATTRPDKMPCAGSTSILYMYHNQVGRLKETVDQIHRRFKYYESLSARLATGIEELVMAEYYLEIADYDRCCRYAKRGIHLAQLLPQIDAMICGYVILARAYYAQGQIEDVKGLICTLEKMDTSTFEGMVESIRSPYYYALDQLNLMIGHLEGLTDELKEKVLNHNLLFFQSKGIGYILYGQFLLKQGDFESLELFCEEMRLQFKTFNYIFGQVHYELLKAITNHRLYGLEEGVESLNQVIDLCRPDSIVTSIIEYGGWILPILEALGNKDTYVMALITGAKSIDASAVEKDDQAKVSIPLTPREREVMAHLCLGKRNAEIATALFVSESAVKKMLSIIYRKYGVKNRMSAIKAYETDNNGRVN